MLKAAKQNKINKIKSHVFSQRTDIGIGLG